MRQDEFHIKQEEMEKTLKEVKECRVLDISFGCLLASIVKVRFKKVVRVTLSYHSNVVCRDL